MITPLQTQEMDMSQKTLILVFLIISITFVSGQNVDPQPEKLVVDIWDGLVTVRWNQSVGTPSNTYYNVQMGNYTGEWKMVPSCMGITETSCDLSSLIYNYRTGYKVRVQRVTGDREVILASKKFLPSSSKLHPPSFTLWPTSSTLMVQVKQKPILRKLFPYGHTYTIYLEERGQDKKKTTAYLKDNEEKDQRTETFRSLHWGRKYCVSIMVEGNGATEASDVSPEKCVLLPEEEKFIITVASLSILGVLAFAAIMAGVLLCYLRRPEKTPSVLKSPISGWFPLSVGEGTMEVVTDKGWFLSSYRTEVKSSAKDPVTHVTVTEDSGEEDRRTSMDSGVSMDTPTNVKGSPPMRQEDSGCGSLGGSESSTSGQTDYPLQEDRTDTTMARKGEDSGVGLLCQLHSSSMNLDGQDSLKEAVAGDSYRSQSPSAVQIQVCDDEEAFKQVLPESVLAEVVTGYRAGPQSCICSGAGQCTWCHKQGLYETGVIKQYRSMCIDNGLLSGKCDFVDSYKGTTFSNYCQKTQMDTVMIDDLETTFIPLGESFPLLTALTPLPPVEGGQDFNMNNVSLSLCDVQLTTD